MLINFTSLTPPDKPNYYLVCPRDYCHAKANAFSPVFDVNESQLTKVVFAVISKQPRTKQISYDVQKKQITYVQRSLIFRFPDYITIQFIGLENNKSTLAIYSRSKYGYSDFGVNRKRVNHWLSLINAKQP